MPPGPCSPLFRSRWPRQVLAPAASLEVQIGRNLSSSIFVQRRRPRAQPRQAPCKPSPTAAAGARRSSPPKMSTATPVPLFLFSLSRVSLSICSAATGSTPSRRRERPPPPRAFPCVIAVDLRRDLPWPPLSSRCVPRARFRRSQHAHRRRPPSRAPPSPAPPSLPRRRSPSSSASCTSKENDRAPLHRHDLQLSLFSDEKEQLARLPLTTAGPCLAPLGLAPTPVASFAWRPASPSPD